MQGLAASVETALGAPSAYPPGTTVEGADEIDSRNPASRAELEKELSRKNLHPVARQALEAEHQRAFGGGFSAGLVESAVNGAKEPAKEIKPKALKAEPIQAAGLGLAGNPIGETALHAVSSVGSSIIGGWRGLAELAKGGSLEDAVKAVHGTDDNAIAGVYQPTSEGGKRGAEMLASPANPLNWVGYVGNKAGEFTTDTATKLGAGPKVAAGAGAAVDTAINAAPLLLLKGGKNVQAPEAFRPNLSAAEALKLPAEAGGTPVPLQTVPAGATVASSPNASKPRIKGPPADLVETKAPEFSESAPVAQAGGKLPGAEQARRIEVLKRVGIENARKSAVEGDPLAAATDHQTSRVDSTAGRFMKSTLDNEKAALADHAEKIVEDTGGTVGTGEDARMARGAKIVAPLDSLKQWFDNNISGLYKAADEKAGGVPVDLPEVHNFVADHRANFLGTTEGKALLEGVTERMKSLGMVDKEGNAQPVTVAQAEKLSQYLGEVWTPRTGRLISQLKDNILEGVTRNAGEDIYKQARALRAMRAATLDDPKGISQIMDASGPEKINRAVPVEKIPDAVAGMPVEQLKHIVRTLENVPAEIKPEAQAAIAEIRAHMANKVLDAGTAHAGQWNARGVSKLLKNNAAKIGIVFTPEQIAKFGDLNEAGHILFKDQSYPGAAVQEHNLLQKGTMAGIRSGGAALGGFVGGPLGAAVGERMGAAAATKLGEAATLRAAQKRVVRLSDFPK